MDIKGLIPRYLNLDDEEICEAHFVPESDLVPLWKDTDKPLSISEFNEVKYINRNKYPQREKAIIDNMFSEYALKLEENPIFTKIKLNESKSQHAMLQEKIAKKYKMNKNHPREGRVMPVEIAHKLNKKIEYEPDPKTIYEFQNVSKPQLQQSTYKLESKIKCVDIGDSIDKSSLGKVVSPIIAIRPTKFVMQKLINVLTLLTLLVRSKCSMDIIFIIGKVIIDIFLYLVMACSTIMITILINTYDTYQKQHKQVQNNNKNVDNGIINNKDSEMVKKTLRVNK